MNRVAVVIPAHNEASRIGDVVSRALPYADFVIVVDDGSDDGTSASLLPASPRVIFLRHPINMGKGAALKTGCAAAVLIGADTIVTIDGDGQHPPAHIPAVLRHMEQNRFDAVFTFRQGGDRMPFVRRLGNRAVNFGAMTLFGFRSRDIWCGFRAFRADALPRMPWRNRDYSGEIQMALAAGRNGVRYGEFPIPALYPAAAKGVHIAHGLKLLAQMAWWRLSS